MQVHSHEATQLARCLRATYRRRAPHPRRLHGLRNLTHRTTTKILSRICSSPPVPISVRLLDL